MTPYTSKAAALALGVALLVGCKDNSSSSRQGGTTQAAPQAQAPAARPAPNQPAPTDKPAPGLTPDEKRQLFGSAQFDYGRAKLENERNTVQVVDRVGPGVVFITTRIQTQAQVDPNDPFGGYYGGGAQEQTGAGSGFIIDKSGLIMTNNHVVADESGQVGKLTVKFHNDRREYPARVVGRAPAFDVALIKVDAGTKPLTAVTLGDSEEVKTGQKAIAIGNPFGFEFTVTEGIISATNRSVPVGFQNESTNVIQTDAAVNPGNSGGPLINSSGEVVGINTQIIAPGAQQGGTAQFGGIAFAVPINLAKAILPSLRQGRTVDRATVEATRPRLGVGIQDLSRYSLQALERYKLPSQGVLITSVEAGGPAAQAGLRAGTKSIETANGPLPINGDVITAVNGKSISSFEDLQSTILFSARPGEPVKLTVLRGGETLSVTVQPKVLRPATTATPRR